MRKFTNYKVWELSHKFTLKVFDVTKKFPTSERFNLILQMQRAAYSIPSNFAEGCGRGSDKDFNRFVNICLGSAHELEYFIILTSELNYINKEDADFMLNDLNNIKKKLFSLSKKLIQ